MSIKFLVLGGGGYLGFFWGGGREADFIFMDAQIFLSFCSLLLHGSQHRIGTEASTYRQTPVLSPHGVDNRLDEEAERLL